MAITWAKVVAIAPELVDTVPPTRAAVLEYVDLQVFDGTWGTRADMARVYLAAHLATMVNRGGAAASGPVVSESVGDVSTAYAQAAVAAAASAALGATAYGVQFQHLVSINPIARCGFVV